MGCEEAESKTDYIPSPFEPNRADVKENCGQHAVVFETSDYHFEATHVGWHKEAWFRCYLPKAQVRAWWTEGGLHQNYNTSQAYYSVLRNECSAEVCELLE